MSVKKAYNKIRFYLSFLLLGFYFTVGFMFLFSDVWADLFPKGRATIGLILIAFGGIRFYIAYRRYAKKHIALHTKEQEKENASAE